MIKIYVVPRDDSKKEKARAWIHNKKVDFECWWDENKETVIALTPVIVGGITVAFKFGDRLVKNHNAKWMRERSIWDPKQQHWWIMTKKPTPWQWSEIERRKNNGESVSDILRDLGMLK